MNETWGPPIKDKHGTVVSVEMGTLSPHYGNRKRRGITPPESEDSSPPKKLKKTHKKLTAPGSDDVLGVRGGRSGTAEPSVKQKKVVLLPPRPAAPDGKSCVSCEHTPEGGCLWYCMLCKRAAFCSIACTVKQCRQACSAICQSESEGGDTKRDKAPGGRADSPSSLPDLEPDKESGSSSSADDPNRDTMPPRRPPEDDEGTEAELRDFLTWDIVDFRIDKTGRVLIFVLRNVRNGETKSLPAVQMLSDEWGVRIDDFWVENDEANWKREVYEHPFGNMEHEPGSPFERRILNVRIDEGRFLDFNVRNFEQRLPDEDGDYSEFWIPSDLGPE